MSRAGAAGALLAVFALAVVAQGCATTPTATTRLGLREDVVVSETLAGWLRIDPSGCVLKTGSGASSTTDDRECSGRIDLNGDGRAETLVTLYVFGQGARLTVFDGDGSRVGPIFQADGYALMATTERQSRGWPILAVFGDAVSADERIGDEQAWTGQTYAPR